MRLASAAILGVLLIGIALAAGLLAHALGVAALAMAGRRYLAGAIGEVRRASRRAGILAAAGAASAALACVLDSPLAASALVGSGAVALLGGLSGKPSPAAGFSIGFALVALAALAVAFMGG